MTSSRHSYESTDKEKIDRQLMGQSSLTPFRNTKDGYNCKKISFDIYDSLDEKIGKLTSI